MVVAICSSGSFRGICSHLGLLKKMPEYGVYIDESWDLGYLPYLVGGLEHFLFFHILRIIIESQLIIFSEGMKPPTSMRFGLFSLFSDRPWQFSSELLESIPM
jgi:hypothetical protein